ncbi:unnamed protein product [Closterium sp. NIES-54]
MRVPDNIIADFESRFVVRAAAAMEDVVLPSIRVGHSGGGAFESLASDPVEKKKLTLGVCVMEKKVGRRGREGRWEAEVRDVIPLPSYLSRQPLPPFPFHHPPSATPLPPSPFPPPFAIAIVSHGPPLAPLPPFLPPPLPPPHSATPLLSPLFRHPFCSRSSLMAAILDRLGPLVDLPLPAPTISPLLSANPSPPSPLQSRSSPMTAILDRLRMFGEVEVRSGGGGEVEVISGIVLATHLLPFPLQFHVSPTRTFSHYSYLSIPLSLLPHLTYLSRPSHSSPSPISPLPLTPLLRGRPYLVNELEPQWLLHDRRKVYALAHILPLSAHLSLPPIPPPYQKLEEHGLMMPTYAIVNREGEGEGEHGSGLPPCQHPPPSTCPFPPHYQKLEEHGLMMPTYAIVNREGEGEAAEEEFEEEEDYVVIAGKRINKPFVEKPVDGGCMDSGGGCMGGGGGCMDGSGFMRCDDHSVMIYYPSSAGGGMKELFRKVLLGAVR